ncbi:KEOPS complex subunit Pcc1 [Halobaculum sp. D14]|uniref:KEOPS complex subunit Pcc1 n=1 Tax=unclassified Halobaculum TaxID=2640896 RepID=UPI003EB7DE00
MTGEQRRSAVVETRHRDADAAATVAAAVSPDNTADVDTEADADRVETRISRERTGGLQASTDDYLVNVAVATDVIETARSYTNTQ